MACPNILRGYVRAVFVASSLSLGWMPAIGHANEIRLSPTDSAQVHVELAADGVGGVFVSWSDRRTVNFRDQTYLHHVTSLIEAVPGWAEGGRAVFEVADHPALLSDGAGGAYIVTGNSECCRAGMSALRVASDGSLPAGWVGPLEWTLSSPLGSDFAPNEVLLRNSFFHPALALDANGDLLLGYTFGFQNDTERLTRITSSGAAPAGFRGVQPYGSSSFQQASAVCSDPSGGAYIAFVSGVRRRVLHWTDGPNGFNTPSCTTSVWTTSPGLVPDAQGGVYVFWQGGTANTELASTFVQRMMADGSFAPGWSPDGLRLSEFVTAAGTRRYAQERYHNGSFSLALQSSVVTDGAGGAFIAWTDYRSGADGDIYAQHLLATGLDPDWPTNGLAVCAVSGDQELPQIVADGAGGFIVAWQDGRAGQDDIYVQRLDASGNRAPSWPADGLAVCADAAVQREPVLASDGAFGAFVAWEDLRNGPPQVYVARVSYDAAVPTLASILESEATSDAVRLVWHVGASAAGAVSIERRAAGEDWIELATMWPDASGRIVYVDRSVVPSATYQYRLMITVNGVRQPQAATAVTVPARAAFALEPPSPNPAKHRFAIAFTLPDDGAARLEVLDVSGRRVSTREVGGRAGRQSVALGSELEPGFYVIRLARAGAVLTRPLLVTR